MNETNSTPIDGIIVYTYILLILNTGFKKKKNEIIDCFALMTNRRAAIYDDRFLTAMVVINTNIFRFYYAGFDEINN